MFFDIPTYNTDHGWKTNLQLVLHLLCNLMGVDDTRYGHLHLVLLILRCLEGGLALLQVKVTVILA